jgi:hypothetical protein
MILPTIVTDRLASYTAAKAVVLPTVTHLRLSASNYRTVMRRRWREWNAISETTTFAAAA